MNPGGGTGRNPEDAHVGRSHIRAWIWAAVAGNRTSGEVRSQVPRGYKMGAGEGTRTPPTGTMAESAAFPFVALCYRALQYSRCRFFFFRSTRMGSEHHRWTFPGRCLHGVFGAFDYSPAPNSGPISYWRYLGLILSPGIGLSLAKAAAPMG